ncbi:MAG: hypothetical protein RLZZ292_2229 [Bacteroidota bacterium]|jgi:hypothetical protein
MFLKLILISLITLTMACNNQETRKSNQKVDELTKSDTNSLDPLYHYANQTGFFNLFYLGYSEWKTIRCVISPTINDYVDKRMIGLIETTGNLRIEHLGQTIRLKPIKNIKIQKGTWSNTFVNDTIQVSISVDFDNKNMLKDNLDGEGKIIGKINQSTYEEIVYLRY